MRKLLIVFLFCFSVSSYAQVSGDIKNDKRTITKEIDYSINSSKSGEMVYTISVDTDGNVTHCELIQSRSTVKSTPLMMRGKNKIVSGLKFERGSRFPKFHQGEVTIKIVESELDPPLPDN